MAFDKESPKMKALDKKIKKIISNDHIIKEMIFQHLIRHEEFKNIPVGKLKRHSEVIGGMIGNTLHRLNEGPDDYILVTDEDAHDEYYFRDMALNGILRNKLRE